MAERKNFGIAVANAKRLNDCYHELSGAIAERPAMGGDRRLWQFDYANLPSELEGAEREAWNHRCGSGDVAHVAMRGAVASGNLKLWRYGPQGEDNVDRHDLRELTYTTFASGTYQPDNRLLDSANLSDTPLWVKEADWHRFKRDLWTLRYGIDLNNPPPPPDTPQAPPDGPFVTLSHALTWIAFGVSMGLDHLHEVLLMESYGNRVPQQAVKDAVAKLTDLGSGGKIAFRAKYRASLDDNEKTLLTAPVEPIKLDDYRLFSYLGDELGHGDGLLFWRNADGSIIDRILGSGRKDSFLHVKVSRADLLREFPPRSPVLEGFKYPLGHTYTRDDPADIAPWWTVTQALAWIASRIPSYVEYAGRLEVDYCARQSNAGRLMAQVTVENDMSRCDEADAFLLERRTAWTEGSVLAHAGRALLEKILAGEIVPRARVDGRGRAMQNDEFVGIGTLETAGDWLDIEPNPLFLSAEMMKAFPLASLTLTNPNKAAGTPDSSRSPSVKVDRPPSDGVILAKADKMKARGLDGRTIAKQMRLEPGFENVATTAVRDLIRGRWKPAGRPKKAA